MKRMVIPTILVAAALALAGCVSDDESADGKGGNPTDRAFVAEMIPHHRSAVTMAKIAQRRGESAFVRELAADIRRTQTAEISTLRREDEGLELAGIDRGSLGVPEHMTGMDADPASLRSAEPFDEAFIEMMIPHHEGAITMAKVELDKGADPELTALAEDIVETQEQEIRDMRAHLSDSGEEGADHGSGHSG
jgi:uncharacterized protein (DUF305 family)